LSTANGETERGRDNERENEAREGEIERGITTEREKQIQPIALGASFFQSQNSIDDLVLYVSDDATFC